MCACECKCKCVCAHQVEQLVADAPRERLERHQRGVAVKCLVAAEEEREGFFEERRPNFALGRDPAVLELLGA